MTHLRSKVLSLNKKMPHSKVCIHLMRLWNAGSEHLNMTNHQHHHRYHHYYPDDAAAAAVWPLITEWLLTWWWRDDGEKGGRERDGQRREVRKKRTMSNMCKPWDPGDKEKKRGGPRHVVMEVCRWRMEGWQRECERGISVCISKPQESSGLR